MAIQVIYVILAKLSIAIDAPAPQETPPLEGWKGRQRDGKARQRAGKAYQRAGKAVQGWSLFRLPK
jgi:hypothetical protein